jgi:diguanylate cyclase (GGDEF)-like protein
MPVKIESPLFAENILLPIRMVELETLSLQRPPDEGMPPKNEITGHLQAEEALRDSETRYRQLFETAKTVGFIAELQKYEHELLDIDCFKRLHDTFGHEAGDLLLRELGRVLHENIRKSDIACRFGGEEFVLVLLDSPQEASRQHIEKIRSHVKELQVRYGDQLLGTMTLTAGIVEAPDHDMTAEELLRAADEALYAAKRAGRDRIVVFSDLANRQK